MGLGRTRGQEFSGGAGTQQTLRKGLWPWVGEASGGFPCVHVTLSLPHFQQGKVSVGLVDSHHSGCLRPELGLGQM